MQKALQISLIQSELLWEDRSGNLAHFDAQINRIDNTDLILLPEMFTSGFTRNASKVAEPMQGPTLKWMQTKAAEKQALIAGSLVIVENGKYYNRFMAVFPDGKYVYSDKRHLFSFAKEDTVYTRGENRIVFTYKGFRILPLVCYDLRFPVWARYQGDYDMIMYVANWPAPRINAWDILLQARAVENMCYVAGLNRVGTDAKKLRYPGHSAVYGPLGERCTEPLENTEGILSAQVDIEELTKIRDQFGFLNDRDAFDIR